MALTHAKDFQFRSWALVCFIAIWLANGNLEVDPCAKASLIILISSFFQLSTVVDMDTAWGSASHNDVETI